MDRLKDRVALVTGAAQGIGLGIATTFAGEGARLVLADANAEKGERAAKLICRDGGSAISCHTDVAQETDVRRTLHTAIMLTKSLAVDLGPDKIRVNCIWPGLTDTPMLRFHVSHEEDPDAHLQNRLRRVPLGNMLFPEDIGQAALFLSSDDARGITGSSLVIDGGYLACAEFHPPENPKT